MPLWGFGIRNEGFALSNVVWKRVSATDTRVSGGSSGKRDVGFVVRNEDLGNNHHDFGVRNGGWHEGFGPTGVPRSWEIPPP